jgi:hypothetical protein
MVREKKLTKAKAVKVINQTDRRICQGIVADIVERGGADVFMTADGDVTLVLKRGNALGFAACWTLK